MRLIYASANRLLSQSAPPLQMIQNCTALAGLAEVHFIAQDGYQAAISGPDASTLPRSGPKSHVAEYYGIAIPDSLHLHILPEFEWRAGRVRLHVNDLYHLACLIKVHQLHRKHPADAILVRNLKLARFILRRRNVLRLPPVIYEAHEVFSVTSRENMERLEIYDQRKEQRMIDLEGYVLGQVDGIISVTEHMSGRIRTTYKTRGKILTLPNGIALSQCEGLEGAEPDSVRTGAKTIMYLGSLHHWKGVDILIEAMKYIPDALLRIVGGDDKAIKSHRETAESLGVSDRVRFDGYISPGKRFRCLREADVLVLPLRPVQMSAYFTSPLKIFEYMASERPIVTSDLPSTRELLTHDANAVLVSPQDPKALADGILRVLRDEALARRLAERAASDVQSHTWERRASRVIEFVKSVSG